MNLTPNHKQLIVRVVNVFETGKAAGDYAAIAIYADGPNDVRQITYGPQPDDRVREPEPARATLRRGQRHLQRRARAVRCGHRQAPADRRPHVRFDPAPRRPPRSGNARRTGCFLRGAVLRSRDALGRQPPSRVAPVRACRLWTCEVISVAMQVLDELR